MQPWGAQRSAKKGNGFKLPFESCDRLKPPVLEQPQPCEGSARIYGIKIAVSIDPSRTEF